MQHGAIRQRTKGMKSSETCSARFCMKLSRWRTKWRRDRFGPSPSHSGMRLWTITSMRLSAEASLASKRRDAFSRKRASGPREPQFVKERADFLDKVQVKEVKAVT